MPASPRISTILLVLAGCGDDGSRTGQGGGSTDTGSGTAGDSGSADAGDDTDGGTTDGSVDETGGGSSGGEPEGSLPLFRSGDRLRARVWDGGDGARLFAGWYDNVLDLDCYVARLDEVGPRCVPLGGFTGTFVDADCTEGVFVAGEDCEVPQYAISSSASANCYADGVARGDLWEVGESVPDTQRYGLDSDGNCIETGGSGSLYALSPADVTPFAALDERIFETDDALGVRLFAGEDGSHQVYATVDIQRDADCRFWGDDPHPACVVAQLTVREELHADDTCSDDGLAVAYGPEVDCDFEVAVRGNELREVGDPVADSDVSNDSLGTCDPWQPNGVAYTLGPPVAEGTFPAVQVGSIGTGRLALTTMESLDGEILAADVIYGWSDAELGQCYPRRTTRGDIRCSPIDGSTQDGEYWADATCADTSLHFENNAGLEPEDTLRRVYVEQACGERLVDRVVRIGPQYNGAVHRRDPETGDCTPLDAGSGRFFEYAESLPTTELALVELVVE